MDADMNIRKNEFSLYETGNSKNPAIIFVHGFPYDHFMWDKVTANLSKEFYCITYDIRGMGTSGNQDLQFTMEDLVDDLYYVIDKLKLNKPFLCGLSMGGYISLRAVEKEEFKFRGLILCDTKSAADNDEAKLKRAAGIKKINEDGIQKFAAEFVENCFAKESIERLGEEYIALLGRSMNTDPAGAKACILAMAARTDTTSYLTKLKLPALILCGEEDNLTPPALMKQMHEKISNSEFYIVPDSGHMSPVENPDFVCEKMRGFLKK
jgi:pimeloyl-ACP methyl ester carboxylesterase